jgi:hypothetical protein
VLGWQKTQSFSDDTKLYGEHQFDLSDNQESNFLLDDSKSLLRYDTGSSNQTTSSAITKNVNAKHDQTNLSHLSVSQTFQSTGSWDEVANNLSFGKTEFCYLEQTFHDHYKFNIKDSFPTTILSNKFTTLSKNGVLRSMEGGTSELITYNELANEIEIYNKLKQINFFSKFKLWKTIYLWKYVVRKSKFKKTVISDFLFNIIDII